jgi:ABC-type phosphate/phosphonate transport system substrate-binding protein
MNALGRADKAAALAYFADPARYDAVLTAMGGNMRLLAASMSGFALVEVTPAYATAVVNQAAPSGTVSQHYVIFVLNDGRWQVAEF